MGFPTVVEIQSPSTHEGLELLDKLILILFVIVTLSWEGSEGANGYKVYQGMSSGSYPSVMNVGPFTSVTFDIEKAGTFYFAVTAYNDVGESGYSNEVRYTVKKGKRSR